MKLLPEELQSINVGTRVTIHNSVYNNRKPFNATVELSLDRNERNQKVIKPDEHVIISHDRYRIHEQHFMCHGEYFSIINYECNNLPDDLFEV